MSAPPSPIEREQQAIAKELRLRGAPAPVARVSRKALMVAGAVLSAGLAGAAGWSLTEHPKKTPQEAAPETPPPPEKISTLPRDYLQRGAPPILGPPLPGDLGRPILSAQVQGGQTSGASITNPADRAARSVDRPPAPIDPVVHARRAALTAARQSDVFLKKTSLPGPSAVEPVEAARSAGSAIEDARLTSPERLQAPASPYLLQAGSIIPAALVTGLRPSS